MFEITGKPSKIDSFIAIMVPLGLVEVVRTGLAAISRGPKGCSEGRLLVAGGAVESNAGQYRLTTTVLAG